MTRYLKILLILIGVIVVILVAGYFAIRSYLNPVTVRTIAERIASETLDRPVQFGSVGLTFGFKVGIAVKDVTIANTKGFGSEPVVQVERTTLILKLLPLLQKKVIISGLDFSGLIVNVERNKAGIYNFMTLLPKEQTGTGWALSLEKVTINNGEIRYMDAKDRIEARLKDLKQLVIFKANGIQTKGKGTVHIIKSTTLPEMTVYIANSIAYDTMTQILQIDKFNADYDPLSIGISGSIEKMDLMSIHAELKIRDLDRIKQFIPASSRPAELAGAIKADCSILGSLKDPQIDGRCEFHKVRIVPPGMLKGLERIDGSMSFDQNTIRNILLQGLFGGAKIKISGSVANIKNPMIDINTKVNGDLSDFTGITPEMQGIQMKGPINADVTLKGKTSALSYSGDYAISGAHINGIGLTKPVTNLNVKGTFAKDKAVVDACSGHIGRSDFSFNGAVSRFNEPIITVNNTSNVIDIDELLPEQGTEQNGVPVTIKGSVNINTLTGLDMEYKNVKANFIYDKGIIEVSQCNADAFDGRINLDFYYNSNNPEPYRISSNMTSISAQKILKRFLNVDNIEGQLTGMSAFSGRGFEVKEVISNLSASGNLKLKKGVFNNFDMLVKLLAWLGMQEQRSIPIDDLNMSFKIDKGKVKVDNWALAFSHGDFLWNGTIGLDGSLDLDVTTTLNKKHSDIVKQHHGDWIFYIDKQGRAVIDCNVIGSFKSPAFSLDKNKIKKRIQGKVQEKFDEKKKEIDNKIEQEKKDWEKKVKEEKEKWEKKLKGLLK